MAHYYFFFPDDMKLNYIQPIKAKNIDQAWEIMSFFFTRFCGYGFTKTQLIDLGLYYHSNFLPTLNINDVREVLNEQQQKNKSFST